MYFKIYELDPAKLLLARRLAWQTALKNTKVKLNCQYILLLIKYKNRNIILKTEQMTIVYAQCDRWTSYDVIKYHMITTDVI